MLKSVVDVIVVGGGPGGSAAAKRCAEKGWKTLLLEKRKLPRDKVCSGMLMSHMTRTIVEQEFGEVPGEVLTDPSHLSGIMLHVPGIEPERIEHKIPLAWRKDLDYWMSRKAEAAGAEIWDKARVLSIIEEADGYIVKLEREGEEEEAKARFVIGADGANSVVRRSFFPTLNVVYGQEYRECYHGELNLDKKYIHFFFLSPFDPYSFGVHHKGDAFLVEVGSRMAQLKENIHKIKGMLTKELGVDPMRQPSWRDGCLIPLSLYRELFSGSFSPARGNVLLVGDAAGLLMPVTFEGIGTAIKSGLAAASSAIKAREDDQNADNIYLTEIAETITTLKRLYPLYAKIRQQASKGGQYLLDGYKEALKDSLNIA